MDRGALAPPRPYAAKGTVAVREPLRLDRQPHPRRQHQDHRQSAAIAGVLVSDRVGSAVGSARRALAAQVALASGVLGAGACSERVLHPIGPLVRGAVDDRAGEHHAHHHRHGGARPAWHRLSVAAVSDLFVYPAGGHHAEHAADVHRSADRVRRHARFPGGGDGGAGAFGGGVLSQPAHLQRAPQVAAAGGAGGAVHRRARRRGDGAGVGGAHHGVRAAMDVRRGGHRVDGQCNGVAGGGRVHGLAVRRPAPLNRMPAGKRDAKGVCQVKWRPLFALTPVPVFMQVRSQILVVAWPDGRYSTSSTTANSGSVAQRAVHPPQLPHHGQGVGQAPTGTESSAAAGVAGVHSGGRPALPVASGAAVVPVLGGAADGVEQLGAVVGVSQLATGGCTGVRCRETWCTWAVRRRRWRPSGRGSGCCTPPCRFMRWCSCGGMCCDRGEKRVIGKADGRRAGRCTSSRRPARNAAAARPAPVWTALGCQDCRREKRPRRWWMREVVVALWAHSRERTQERVPSSLPLSDGRRRPHRFALAAVWKRPMRHPDCAARALAAPRPLAPGMPCRTASVRAACQSSSDCVSAHPCRPPCAPSAARRRGCALRHTARSRRRRERCRGDVA
eukprot:ctg_578.g256